MDGDILVGKNLKKFVPNPTLEATKHVAMDVLFTNIEVEGNFIVKNLFNSTTIKQWLEDVVYKVLTTQDVLQEKGTILETNIISCLMEKSIFIEPFFYEIFCLLPYINMYLYEKNKTIL